MHEQRCRISARLKIGKPCSGWGEETLFFRKYYLRRIVFFCASLCAQSQMALARVLPLLRSHCFAHRSAMSGVIAFNEGTTMQHTLSRISTIFFSTSPGESTLLYCKSNHHLHTLFKIYGCIVCLFAENIPTRLDSSCPSLQPTLCVMLF